MRASVAAVVAIAFLSSTPARAADPDPWFGPDKKLHFEASAAIAAGGYGAIALVSQAARYTPTSQDRLPRFAGGAWLALGAGVGKELWDLSGHGDPSFRDLTWDVAGTVAGLVIAVALDWAITRLSRRPATPQ